VTLYELDLKIMKMHQQSCQNECYTSGLSKVTALQTDRHTDTQTDATENSYHAAFAGGNGRATCGVISLQLSSDLFYVDLSAYKLTL